MLLFQTKACADSGSETDNEEMEVPEEAAATSKSFGKDSSPSKSGAMFQQNEEEDYASDGSSDILQPTQVSSNSSSSSAVVSATVVVAVMKKFVAAELFYSPHRTTIVEPVLVVA